MNTHSPYTERNPTSPPTDLQADLTAQLSRLLFFVLCALFVHWWWTSPNATDTVPLCVAICSFVLFTGVCIRLVPSAMQFCFFQDDAAPGPDPDNTGPQPGATRWVFFAYLCFAVCMVAYVQLVRLLSGESTDLSFWRCCDAQHYLDIAVDWYLSEGSIDRLVQLVFLPGYPLLVRLVSLLCPNLVLAGLLSSCLCFAGAGAVLYQLLCLDMPHTQAMRTLRYVCLLPGAFFYAAPMSESLFLLLCGLCLLMVRKRQFTLGCLFGGLAAFTRSLGLLLLVPVTMEFLHQQHINLTALQKRRQAQLDGAYDLSNTKRLDNNNLNNNTEYMVLGRPAQRPALQALSLLLIPAGFGVYCLINYLVSGNPFQYSIYQAEHWGQHLGLFFNTAAYQTRELLSSRSQDQALFYGLWLPNLACSLIALLLMLCVAGELRASMVGWFAAYYFIAIGPTWLLSAPRYLLVLLPLPMALTRLSRSKYVDISLTTALLFFSLCYTDAFALRWQVW